MGQGHLYPAGIFLYRARMFPHPIAKQSRPPAPQLPGAAQLRPLQGLAPPPSASGPGQSTAGVPAPSRAAGPRCGREPLLGGRRGSYLAEGGVPGGRPREGAWLRRPL